MRSRDAEICEPLLTTADAAGTDWPDRARAACAYFCQRIGAERDNEELRLLATSSDRPGSQDRGGQR